MNFEDHGGVALVRRLGERAARNPTWGVRQALGYGLRPNPTYGLPLVPSKQLIKIAEKRKLGRIELDVAVGARKGLDPLRPEMLFDVGGGGFEIEVPVATARMTAVDEAD